MNIMDLFRGAKQPEPLAGATQAEEAKKVAEAAAAQKLLDDAALAKAAESPLDKFSEVFKMDAKEGETPPLFNIDPIKLTEQASKTNFTNAIPQEILAKIEAGGKEGVIAMMSAINNVAQTNYAQSTLVAAKLVEHATEKQRKYYEEVAIPNLVRQLGIQQTMMDDNPALNHPAVAPVMEAVRENLAKQHPDSSQKEIAAMTKDFMSAFANAVNPPKGTTQQPGKKETDWSTFLS